MFIFTRLSAPEKFAKFGWQTRAISHKENEKMNNAQCTNSVLNAKKIFLAAVKERVMSTIFSFAKGQNEALT